MLLYQLIIEKILSYFIIKEVLVRIYRMFNFIKFVLVVRDFVIWVILDYIQIFSKYGKFKFF